MKRILSLNMFARGAVMAGALIAPAFDTQEVTAQEPVLTGEVESPAFDQDVTVDEARADEVAIDEATTDEAALDVEVIRERYPNRAVKIEREVIRDADDNYVNHGTWKYRAQNGTLLAEGRYENGKRQGQWKAWLRKGESKIFSQAGFEQFKGPFVSVANFEEGQLHGAWSIHDRQDRKIGEWNYAEGLRHGSWTTWFPNGKKKRQVQFEHGELMGEATTWNANGTIVRKEAFRNGRRLATKTTNYVKGVKKTEGVYLLAKQQLVGQDDWSKARFANFKTIGQDERHGDFKEWYTNGQLRMQGKYENDLPTGTLTWWYENGQRSAEGRFLAGQKSGRWTWWHANGQKSIDGEYLASAPHGAWIWWNAKGQVSQRVEYSAAGSPVDASPVDTPAAEAIVREADSQKAKLPPQVAERPERGTRTR